MLPLHHILSMSKKQFGVVGGWRERWACIYTGEPHTVNSEAGFCFTAVVMGDSGGGVVSHPSFKSSTWPINIYGHWHS